MSVEGFEFHSTLFCRYASILSLLPNWNNFFLRLFALFHFLLKLCSFKRENLWRNISCLFCFALYTFANYHSFRRFCWREKYHLWFLNCNTIYWIHKKYPNRGYSCWLCQEKGGENLPSSAVLKISCKLILRTKWWTEKDFQYSKTRNYCILTISHLQSAKIMYWGKRKEEPLSFIKLFTLLWLQW